MRDKLRRIVRDKKLLTPERLEECLREEASGGETLDRILLQKGYLTEMDTLRLFGEAFGMQVIENLGDVQVPAEFVNNVPVQFARSYNLVALGSNGNGDALRVATCSPYETNALDDLATMLSCETEPIL